MKIIKSIFRWILKIIGWVFVLGALNGIFRYNSVFDPATSSNPIYGIISIIIFLLIGLTLISKTSKK